MIDRLADFLAAYTAVNWAANGRSRTLRFLAAYTAVNTNAVR
ncbi:hypothetical protein [Pseudomonas aeruginosa]|nr:hypothetical protein CSC44_4507 [Pseudomonas aeruginosa]